MVDKLKENFEKERNVKRVAAGLTINYRKALRILKDPEGYINK